MSNDEKCTYEQGPLPVCAPLALSQMPVQVSSLPAYDSAEALANGTLFPGLDLPFMNYIASGPVKRTPLTELMALDFVAHELMLYLDTHPDDNEAFSAWKDFNSLAQEAQRRYTALYGPVTAADTAAASSWIWPCDPWPWERGGKAGAK